MEPVDADYRVVGEDKWAPFRRWLYPKIGKAIGWLIVFVMMLSTLLLTRWLQGAY